jgi:hypothetical protein
MAIARNALVIAVLAGLLAAGAAATLAGDEDLFDAKRESFACEAPKVEIARPDPAWMFVRLDVQRQEAEAATPGASRAFEGLIARLHCPGTKATISVYNFPLASPPPDLEHLAAHAAQEARARKDGAVGGQSEATVGGRQVVVTEFSATVEQTQGGARAGDTYLYSRIDATEPEFQRALVILFETPKASAGKAVPAWKKVLQKLKLA